MGKNTEGANKAIVIKYKFIFGTGLEKEIRVELDSKTHILIKTGKASHPEWTRLKFFKCPNCSLDENRHIFCPIANNIVELVDFFGDSISYDEVNLVISSAERKYMKHTTLQQGISSLLGIYMVTSGCPVMEKLKPLVATHLPFATLKETQYRVLSMYLLAQYFLSRRGKKPDWELKHLVKIYDGVQIVNQSFFKRLSNSNIKDATLNALVKLDIFARHIPVLINKNALDEMEGLFTAYYE